MHITGQDPDLNRPRPGKPDHHAPKQPSTVADDYRPRPGDYDRVLHTAFYFQSLLNEVHLHCFVFIPDLGSRNMGRGFIIMSPFCSLDLRTRPQKENSSNLSSQQLFQQRLPAKTQRQRSSLPVRSTSNLYLPFQYRFLLFNAISVTWARPFVTFASSG